MQEKTLKKQMQRRLQKQRIKREYAKSKEGWTGSKEYKGSGSKDSQFYNNSCKKKCRNLQQNTLDCLLP